MHLWPIVVRHLFICTVAVCGFSAEAAEPLFALSGANSAEVVLQRWHRSLASGDWAEYQKVIAPVPGNSVEIRRAQFQAMREWTPEAVKITTPKAGATGNLELFVLGCAKGRRQAAHVILVKSADTWLVLSTGWGDVWSPDVKKCPV